jgi:hypothetical protein
MALVAIYDHVGNHSNRVSHQDVDQEPKPKRSEQDQAALVFTSSVHAPKWHLWHNMIIELKKSFLSIDFLKGLMKMTTTMTIGNTHNQKTFEHFVATIRDNVEASTRNWHAVASAFAEAKEMFGSNSDTFKALCSVTKFSVSKASKLASIASSERLKTNSATLSTVHNWTVLYQITTLTDEQFVELLKNANEANSKTIFKNDAPFFSLEMVLAAKRGKVTKSPMVTYATIRIDFPALKAQLIDGAHISTLEEHLRQIETSLPYLQVARTEVDQSAERLFLNKVHTATETAERKAFAALLERQLAKIQKRKKEKTEAYWHRVFGMNKDELWSMFRSDKKIAFEHFGAEFDQGQFWNEGQDTVSKQMDKIAKTIQASRDAFQFANTVTSSAELAIPTRLRRGKKYPKEMFAGFE